MANGMVSQSEKMLRAAQTFLFVIEAWKICAENDQYRRTSFSCNLIITHFPVVFLVGSQLSDFLRYHLMRISKNILKPKFVEPLRWIQFAIIAFGLVSTLRFN